MKTQAMCLTALTALLLLSGCQSSQTGNPELYSTAKSLNTKEQVLKTLGGPMATKNINGDQALIYAYKKAEGRGIGAGYYGIGLLIGQAHAGPDIVTFIIGPDGHVKEHKMGIHTTHELEKKFWPFDQKE